MTIRQTMLSREEVLCFLATIQHESKFQEKLNTWRVRSQSGCNPSPLILLVELRGHEGYKMVSGLFNAN